MKAASFSQAESLTLLSRAVGQSAVGRRWLLKGNRSNHYCDTVDASFAASELGRPWPFAVASSGTIVRWDSVRSFPGARDHELVADYLTLTINHLRNHLGLMFHRILNDDGVTMTIDVEDISRGLGPPHRVKPIDPFEYPTAPESWPKDLAVEYEGILLSLCCHIWPGRSNLPQYRLPGGAEQHQGLYFYRNRRLLQPGGWEGIHTIDRKLQLARVVVDIDDNNASLFRFNTEKSRVSAGPLFARLAAEARAVDGSSISAYLRAAEDQWIVSNQRATAKRSAVLPPGKGLHPAVCREIRDELPQHNEEPLNILWRSFHSDDFLEIDRPSRTLWLNDAYRRALLGGRRGGLNDVPVIKALLFMLIEGVFEGAYLGARDRDNLELWNSVLTSAARAQKSAFESNS